MINTKTEVRTEPSQERGATIHCSKRFCLGIFSGGDNWVQLDVPGHGEPIRAFCSLKCLHVWLTEYLQPRGEQ